MRTFILERVAVGDVEVVVRQVEDRLYEVLVNEQVAGSYKSLMGAAFCRDECLSSIRMVQDLEECY